MPSYPQSQFQPVTITGDNGTVPRALCGTNGNSAMLVKLIVSRNRPAL